MRRTIIASVVFLSGCGALTGDPGPAGAPGAPGKDGMPGAMGIAGKDSTVSGSRIRAVYRTTDDGAREAIGWHDSKLDVRCEFMVAADGKRRCLPSDSTPGSSAVFFSGAGCDSNTVVAVGIRSKVCPPPVAHVLVLSYESCPPTHEVYTFAEDYTGSEPVSMEQLHGQGCDVATTSIFTLRAATRVDPSSFVEAADSAE